MALRTRTLSAVILLITCLFGPFARANNPLPWTYGSTNYATQAEAVAAMQAASPQNSVLTWEIGATDMAGGSVQYQYGAPAAGETVTTY
jgi:hypothetical protein